MLLTSIIWIVTGAGSGNPLHDLPALALPVSVALQELFRWLLYRLLRRADKVLEIVSDDKSPLRRHKFAYGKFSVSLAGIPHTVAKLANGYNLFYRGY